MDALGDVILIGMLLSVFSSCALFFFDDECTLGEESEAINHSASGRASPSVLTRSPCASSEPARPHIALLSHSALCCHCKMQDVPRVVGTGAEKLLKDG